MQTLRLNIQYHIYVSISISIFMSIFMFILLIALVVVLIFVFIILFEWSLQVVNAVYLVSTHQGEFRPSGFEVVGSRGFKVRFVGLG